MTVAARWKKIARDLAARPVRVTLAVLAMAAGIFGVTTTMTAYSILRRELAVTYSATRPSSATLTLDRVNDDDVAIARTVAGVRDAEARPVLSGRLRLERDQWIGFTFFVVRDFNDIRLDTLTRDRGSWPPGARDVLLERSALSVAHADVGNDVTLRTSYVDADRVVRVAGSVHAAGLAPAWMEHHVLGFVSWDSVLRDPRSESAQLRIAVRDRPLDRTHIADVAARVQTALEHRGRTVLRVDIPEPGRHPHAAQMDTFLYILGAFGLLTLLLSALLVANLIHALLSEQLRQIGVMKAIGARTSQIAALYLAQVTLLATIALVLGITAGLFAGRAYARGATNMLNAVIRDASVPMGPLAAQIAIGLLVPLLVAFVPIRRAARISVQQALAGDRGQHPFGTHALDRALARISWLPRPLMLSLRTTFHRRGRLTLTVASLAVGGAVLIAALNLSATWSRVIADDYAGRHYELDVRLVRPYAVDALQSAMATLPSVTRAESWPDTGATLLDAKPGSPARISLIAPPAGSTLLRLPLLEGRWLATHDRDAMVINQALQSQHPELRVGSKVRLRIHAEGSADVQTWTIVGIVKEIGSAAVYAPAEIVRRATGESIAMSRSMRVVLRDRDDASQLAAQRAIEQTLQRSDIGVLWISRLSERRKSFEDHLVILHSALLFAASLVILVGALGVLSTLSLNVLERTRELAILGAIGATPRTIASHIVFEGVLIGFLSWLAALLLAFPATAALAMKTGQLFIKTPLPLHLAPTPIVTSLAVLLPLAAISSLHPARRATHQPIHEALTHE